MGMYVVTQNGKKLPVDDSAISDDEYLGFQRTVGLYTDNTHLDDVWVLQLEKRTDWNGGNYGYESEFVKEILYDHEPTKEEILWAMSEYGLSVNDMAYIHKGLRLNFGSDD